MKYNYFRTYDPTIGRYTQSDPIGLNGGLNSFAYAMLDPLGFYDPYGLSPEDVARMVQDFHRTVAGMTDSGRRHPNPYRNNAESSLNFLTGGAVGKPFLGCGDQSGVVNGVLGQANYDDDWNFKTYQAGPFHQVTKARSSNPSDPEVVLDPWRNTHEVRERK